MPATEQRGVSRYVERTRAVANSLLAKLSMRARELSERGQDLLERVRTRRRSLWTTPRLAKLTS